MKKMTTADRKLLCLFLPMLIMFFGNMASVFVSAVAGLKVIGMLITACGTLVLLQLILRKKLSRKSIFIPLLILLPVILIPSALHYVSSIPESSSIPFTVRSLSDSVMWIAVFAAAYAIGASEENASGRLVWLSALVPLFALLYHGINIVDAGQGIPELSAIYYLLLLLPFVMMIRRKTVVWLLVTVIWCVVLLSLKRTAFLSFLLCIPVYFITDMLVHKREWKNSAFLGGHSLAALLMALCFVCISTNIPAVVREHIDDFRSNIAVSFSTETGSTEGKKSETTKAEEPRANSNTPTMLERMASIESDGGSGRVEIWLHTIDMIEESEPAELLFGHGFNTVYRHSSLKLSAHNDILEIIYDYGFVGLAAYAAFCVYLLCYFFRVLRYKPALAAPYLVSGALFACMTMVSHLIIYPTYFLFLCAFWGIVIGECDKAQVIQKGNV